MAPKGYLNIVLHAHLPYVRHPESEEYIEETLSLNDMEKKAITASLERHHGRRRDAAKELNISERTLYRKIKEYGID